VSTSYPVNRVTLEVVEYLLCHGGDPYRKDGTGKNAFDYVIDASVPKQPLVL